MTPDEAANLLAVVGALCPDSDETHASTGKCTRVDALERMVNDNYGCLVLFMKALCDKEFFELVSSMIRDLDGKGLTREAMQAEVDAIKKIMSGIAKQPEQPGALPAMRAEMQTQFSATEDPMERALLQSALVSIEGANVVADSSAVVSEMKDGDVQKVESAPKEKKYPYKKFGSMGYAVDHQRVHVLSAELGWENHPIEETMAEYMRRADAEDRGEEDEAPKPKANQGFRLRINLKDYTREQAVALAVKINKIDNLDLDVEVTRGEWDDSDDDDVDEILPEPQQDPSADGGEMSQLE